MDYAIIATSGKQYKVSVGKEILVDNLSQDEGSEVIFPQVLMLRVKDEVILGTPYIANSQVIGKLKENIKGPKVNTIKFKAKVHYRRKIGFRPKFSKVVIERINYSEIKSLKKENQKAKKPRESVVED